MGKSIPLSTCLVEVIILVKVFKFLSAEETEASPPHGPLATSAHLHVRPVAAIGAGRARAPQ